MKRKKDKTKTTTAIVYARFSPRKNAAESQSVETQIELAEKYCTFASLEIIGTEWDKNLSGKRADNRPGLQRALEGACITKSVLVVYSLSRLARSTRDAIEIAERLNKAGANLASLTEQINTTSASGRMLFKVLAVLSEFEREVIAERTSQAMIRHQANGRRMGSIIPFGWRPDPQNGKLMLPDESELAAIQEMVRQWEGGTSFKEIAELMESMGVKTRKGNKWQKSAVYEIVRREIDKLEEGHEGDE